MTDKQIIIDEFNASEYAKTAFELAKETLAEKDQLREYYDKLLQRKEQECEELKEINQELLKYRKHSTTCQDCYEDGLEDGKTSNKELRKLRKTLAEIKEIAEACQTPNTCKDYCRFFDVCVDGGLPLILQKINEVEDD